MSWRVCSACVRRVRPSEVSCTVFGRLVMGLGVGGTHQPAGAGGIVGENPAVAEYAAYGLTLVPPAEGIARLAETIDILEGIGRRTSSTSTSATTRSGATATSPSPYSGPARRC